MVCCSLSTTINDFIPSLTSLLVTLVFKIRARKYRSTNIIGIDDFRTIDFVVEVMKRFTIESIVDKFGDNFTHVFVKTNKTIANLRYLTNRLKQYEQLKWKTIQKSVETCPYLREVNTLKLPDVLVLKGSFL